MQHVSVAFFEVIHFHHRRVVNARLRSCTLFHTVNFYFVEPAKHRCVDNNDDCHAAWKDLIAEILATNNAERVVSNHTAHRLRQWRNTVCKGWAINQYHFSEFDSSCPCDPA